MYYPTWVDIWTFVGTFGVFLSLFLLFIRWLPMICIFEVKAVLPRRTPTITRNIGHGEMDTVIEHDPSMVQDPSRRRKEGCTDMESVGNTQAPFFGMAAEVSSASALYHAAEKVRDAGFAAGMFIRRSRSTAWTTRWG